MLSAIKQGRGRFVMNVQVGGKGWFHLYQYIYIDNTWGTDFIRCYVGHIKANMELYHV